MIRVVKIGGRAQSDPALAGLLAAAVRDGRTRLCIVHGGGDEVSELATTINSMLSRIEIADISSRRLVSDASHELRTPIAVMRSVDGVASEPLTSRVRPSLHFARPPYGN